MLIKRKSFAISTGYHIAYDCRYGVSLGFGRRRNVVPDQSRFRLVCGFCFDVPRLIWFNKWYALDEPGYIQGMPVMRRRPKRWRIRGIQWPHHTWWRWHD